MAWYSRSTTKFAVHLCCNPPLAMDVAASSGTPDTRGESVSHCLLQPKPSLPKPSVDYNHHNFLHFCQFHGNLHEDMSHGTDKKTKIPASPKKDEHNRIDSPLYFCSIMCQTRK